MDGRLVDMEAQVRRAAAVAACPGCARTDRAQRVPAVYAANHSTTRVRAISYGPGLVLASRGTARTTTVLGRQLTPPRGSALASMLVVVGLGFGGFFALLAVLGAGSARDASAGLAVAVMMAFGGGTVAAVGFWQLRAGANDVARACRRWASAGYCGRCHGVFFPAGATQRGALVPMARFARELADMAAGYADVRSATPGTSR
jgi:hypothetical protein